MTNKRKMQAWSTANIFQALYLEDNEEEKEEGNADEGELDIDHNAQRDAKDDTSSSEAEGSQQRDTSPSSRLTSILNNDNWRRRSSEEERTTASNIEALKYYDTGHKSDQKKRAARHGPKTPGGVLYEDLCPGTIVWCWDIRNCPDPAKYPTWQTFLKDGRLMVKKGRYFVIVRKVDQGRANFKLGMNGIYSNGDTGVENVHSTNHRKYFSLCPFNVDIENFHNLISGNPVLRMNWMPQQRQGLEPELARLTMLVNWSELVERDIHIEELRIVGTLSDESRDALCSKLRESRAS